MSITYNTTEMLCFTGGDGADVESSVGGATFGLSDERVCTVPLPIPGRGLSVTMFSYMKTLALSVRGGPSSNHISNRSLSLSVAMPIGIHAWFKHVPVYVQAVGPASPNTNANGSVPAGFSGGAGIGGEITTTVSIWDASSIPAVLGINGSMFGVCLGCDSLFVEPAATYPGGQIDPQTMPDIIIGYDTTP